MQLIDLSHTIESQMAQWPGDEQPLRLIRQSEHGPGSHLSSALALGCHVGTHIDAALHFRDGEPALHELPVGHFAGRAVVVRTDVGDCPEALGPEILEGTDLSEVDFVLLHTGWDQHWGTPRYYQQWPWLSTALARALAAANLQGVGLDTPSLDVLNGHVAHEICAEAGLINIENLTNLAALPDGPFLFMALPLKLHGTEASPVRAVAWLD